MAEAFHWEKQIQGWSRRKRELLVEGGLDAVKDWSARERRRASDVDVPPPIPHRSSSERSESKRPNRRTTQPRTGLSRFDSSLLGGQSPCHSGLWAKA